MVQHASATASMVRLLVEVVAVDVVVVVAIALAAAIVVDAVVVSVEAEPVLPLVVQLELLIGSDFAVVAVVAVQIAAHLN